MAGARDVSRQALGRLPWFALFFLRARRLRPVLLMVSSWMGYDPSFPDRVEGRQSASLAGSCSTVPPELRDEWEPSSAPATPW